MTSVSNSCTWAVSCSSPVTVSDEKRRHRILMMIRTMSAVKTPSAMTGSILPRVIHGSLRLHAALKAPPVFTGRRIAKGMGLITVAAVCLSAPAIPLRTNFNNRGQLLLQTGAGSEGPGPR
jgi:hypothetical protein